MVKCLFLCSTDVITALGLEQHQDLVWCESLFYSCSPRRDGTEEHKLHVLTAAACERIHAALELPRHLWRMNTFSFQQTESGAGQTCSYLFVCGASSRHQHQMKTRQTQDGDEEESRNAHDRQPLKHTVKVLTTSKNNNLRKKMTQIVIFIKKKKKNWKQTLKLK